MAATVLDLGAFRRRRAARDRRVADRLIDLDLELGEVLAKLSEWARVLGESSDASELARARRWLLRLSEELDRLKAERRALETPRAVRR
jgi:hypothetical protein